MKTILKNIVVVLVGIISGSIINMSLILLGANIFPTSIDFSFIDAEIKYFIFPFLAHAIGTLSGAYICVKISSDNQLARPMIIGLYFLFGGIYMSTILPAPIWFTTLDLLVCYIPMAWLGWKLNIKK